MSLLVLKEHIKSIYQKTEFYLRPILKFFIAFIVFNLLNKYMGYDERFTKLTVILTASLVCAFTPSSILVLLTAIMSILHIYHVSFIVAIILAIIYILLYLLFIRFTSNMGYIVVIVPILYSLNIPYIIPMALGILFTPISIIPACCGVFIYFLLNIVKSVADMTINMNIEEILQLYTYIINNIIENKQMMLNIVAFIIVIIVTYTIRRMKFDYSSDIAIIVGAVTCILVYVVGDLKFDILNYNVGIIIATIVLSALIVFILKFFKLNLNYAAVEFVQFEDDDYYYYVKAIPKIVVTTPKKNVKKINERKTIKNQNTQSEKELKDL